MITTQLELAAFVTGLALLVFLLTIGVDVLLRWAGRKDPDDVGVQVFLLDDCDDDYGCPMVLPEQVVACADGVHDVQAKPLGDGRWLHECVRCHQEWWIENRDRSDGGGVELAYYGTRVVHRLCMDARRDGGVVCTTCATVMDGVRAA